MKKTRRPENIANSLQLNASDNVALSSFNLHAARRIGGEDRRNLSQLINYMARPPISEARLERTDSGDILYKLKSPWSDGTVGMQLSPSELIPFVKTLVIMKLFQTWDLG